MEKIIVYAEANGAVHVLDYPVRGRTYAHLCGSYSEILPKSVVKELGLEDME
jgi:hypothetical protein